VIFVTVGTLFPFDRMMQAIDEAVASGLATDSFFAQVGVGGYKPSSFDSVEILTKKEYDTYFSRARGVIAHAGIGTIAMALEQRKPILVMPRLASLDEVVSNHQVATAKRFAELGHVIAAMNADQLKSSINQIESFTPKPWESGAASMSDRISQFLHRCEIKSRKSSG
jgi:beta-1,4-N-acetylglucosaminyltransferase